MSSERPDALRSRTQRINTGMGKVYVTITEDDAGRAKEVFINVGQSGGFTNSWANALGMSISVGLRSGATAEDMADVLEGVRTDRVAEDNGDTILSIPDAVAVALKRHVEGKIGESVRDGPPEVELP